MKKYHFVIAVGMLWLACLDAGEWKKNGNTVTDSASALMWQDDMNVQFIAKSWKDADGYCRSLDLDGHKDWRLPSLEELLTIVDYAKSSPAIEASFAYSAFEYYWSASAYSLDKNYAWAVRFSDGYTGKSDINFDNNVRCVRGQ